MIYLEQVTGGPYEPKWGEFSKVVWNSVHYKWGGYAYSGSNKLPVADVEAFVKEALTTSLEHVGFRIVTEAHEAQYTIAVRVENLRLQTQMGDIWDYRAGQTMLEFSISRTNADRKSVTVTTAGQWRLPGSKTEIIAQAGGSMRNPKLLRLHYQDEPPDVLKFAIADALRELLLKTGDFW